jgi:predicted phosphodiesterase
MSTVLVIGDTHCPGMLPEYVDFLADTYRNWDCDRVVHIGDLVDFHAISYHASENGTANGEQEVEQARSQIQQLYKAFPKVDWLLGNHDVLPSRRAADIAGWPRGMLRSYTEFWDIPRWTQHNRFTRLDIDGVLYSHGEVGGGGKHPAILQASKHFQSIVIGHFHSAFGVNWIANENHKVFGMSVGCGVDWKLLQFAYGRKMVSKPIVGCGIVIDGKHPICEIMDL